MCNANIITTQKNQTKIFCYLINIAILPLFQCVWEKYECVMSYMRNKPIRSDKLYSSDKILSLYLALNAVYLSPAYQLASKSSLLLEILMICPAATEYCSSDTGIISRGKVLPKLTTQNRIILYSINSLIPMLLI